VNGYPPGQQGASFSGKILATGKIPNGSYKVVVQLTIINGSTTQYYSIQIYDVTISNGQGQDNPAGTITLATTAGTGSFTASGSKTVGTGWQFVDSKVLVYLQRGGYVKVFSPTYTNDNYTASCSPLTAGNYKALATLALKSGLDTTQVCSGFKKL
jgi:hypothetical protein